jgi:signal transduction histidine kinase
VDERAGYRRFVTRNRPVRAWSPESQWLATLVLAAAIMFSVSAEPAGRTERQMLIPLLACIPVVLLRRWPLPVLGVVTAAAVTITVGGEALLPVGVLLGLALYFVALSLPRSRSIAVALGVAAALGAAMIYSAIAVGIAHLAAEVTLDFVPLAGAWFIADSVKARRRYQTGLAVQAERERAAEVREERVRIAREMHDVVAHALAVITVQAGVGRCLADQSPQEASSALGSIETISRTAQDELRVMLGLLRDTDTGTDAGAEPLAPAPRLVDIKDLADTVRASGVPVELRMSGTDRALSPSLELSVYRVMQEALTNVVKHAPGAQVAAELTVSAGKLRLEVHNDGRPVDGQPSAPTAGTCHGITGMRERIGAFGGWLVAGPVADGGFQVTAEVPVEDVGS